MEFLAGSTDLRLPVDTLDDLLQMGSFNSIEQLQSAFRSRVREEIAVIVEQMVAADAFDLIELMRLREVPISPVLGLEPGFECSGAALEMVALTLTCRASRQATDPDRPDTPAPHELIPALHDAAMRLLRLTTFYMLVSARFSEEPLAALAAEYQANVVNVRTMQYPRLQDQQNAALLTGDRIHSVIESALGFSYEQFINVRDAVADLYSDKFMALRDETAAIVEKYGTLDTAPTEVGERFGTALAQMMFLPGERAQFTAADLADRVDLDVDALRSILDAFSIGFSERDPGDAIVAFLRGDNPFRTVGLVADGQGNYVIAGNPIGTDALRYVVEEALKDGPKWSTYDKARTAVSEGLAIDCIEKLLQVKAQYRGMKYFAPQEGVDESQLGPGCTALTEVGKETECDGLFIVDDLALCVEVKGRSVADQARRGDVRRLARELSNIVGSAAAQARRLEKLIEINGGIWMSDRTWLDLEFVREIRSVAVCLDDIGPLAIAMDDLRRAGILGDDKLPWITSLHDLSVIAQVVDRPAEFLLYVRRRSDSGIAKLYRATDELDLFMLFLSDDHLYIEPDPDHVAAIHPMAPKPTKAARRRFRRSQHLTRVLTHTDPLDAWMYHEDGSSPFPAEKPRFTSNAFVLKIIDDLTNRRSRGWLRATCDLLAASGESQANLERAIKSVIGATRRDHRRHSAMQAFAGLWGLPVVVVGSCPIGTPPSKAVEELVTYAKAKKYQLKSDRAVCISFDEAGEICGTMYLNDSVRDDPEMDELVERLQLQAPRQQPRQNLGKRTKSRPNGGRRSKRKFR
ncbi:hypothetical protein I3U51_21930 [Mycobacteroides abscessus subsp. abscessus]|uniref:hypothetical protein n=1 Tax=Mycobacteroides abscessus TaxID=36809 RepID=UPI0019D2238E|nr:hypothetical protein [Mycobacteroides abscessus]MBN7443198.1 hypothetical protein [Mycobacteroides abscessus subsp. abscessus]